MLALGGTITVQGPGGTRAIAADDFFLGFLETALAPDEMITELRFPACTGAGWAFEKFNKRAQDWAIVGVAAVGGDRPGVALVNMASTPIRAASTEAAVRAGAGPDEAAALADADADPSDDLNATAEFRRHLARVLVRRALTDIARSTRPPPTVLHAPLSAPPDDGPRARHSDRSAPWTDTTARDASSSSTTRRPSTPSRRRRSPPRCARGARWRGPRATTGSG